MTQAPLSRLELIIINRSCLTTAYSVFVFPRAHLTATPHCSHKLSMTQRFIYKNRVDVGRDQSASTNTRFRADTFAPAPAPSHEAPCDTRG